MTYDEDGKVTFFISHSTSNKSELQKIRDSIDGKIIEHIVLRAIVIDPLLGTPSLSEEVKNGLEQSDFFIVVITKESRKSIWVNQEIGYAFGKFASTRILPIVKRRQLPWIQGFITRDKVGAIFEKDSIEPAIQKLKNDLNSILVSELKIPKTVSTQIANITSSAVFYSFKFD